MTKRDLLSKIVLKGMTLWGYAAVRTMRRNTVDAGKKNEALLLRILKANRNTEYGRKFGFADIRTAEDYRKRVPLSTYEDYAPYIARMVEQNETGLITAKRVIGYAQSSGTVGGRKFVPLTQKMIDLNSRYSAPRLLALADAYERKAKRRGLFLGREMFTDSAYDDCLPNGLPCTNVADVTARQFGFLYPCILVIPFQPLFCGKDADYRYVNLRFALHDRNTAVVISVFTKDTVDHFMFLERHWEALVDDVAHGTVNTIAQATPETAAKIRSVLKPDPARADELWREFEQGFDETILKRIWPHLSVISGIGTSTFEPFTRMLRKWTGDIPFDLSIYAASEGLFAACDALESNKQLLLIDSCYYEFIPIDGEPTILPLDRLEVGKQYQIVITNQAGLYRYQLGDVVEVLGYRNDCPYIVFAYREGQLLNLTGEKTTEAHMRAVVDEIEKASGCAIRDWAVYNDLDDQPYHYVLLIENDAGADLRGCGALAHARLREINVRYAHFFDMMQLGAITVGNLQPGTNKAWMQKQIEKGVSASQVKPVRLLDTPEKLAFFSERVIESK